MALLNSRALKRDATPPMTGKIAKKDIIRVNSYGQTVVVVAEGQPIPDGLDLEPGEATSEKKAKPAENKAAEGRPTPKAPAKSG
jgi:hypothetical protein